jgi:hypothetical protein
MIARERSQKSYIVSERLSEEEADSARKKESLYPKFILIL